MATVSVITPTYNHGHELSRAIQSVLAQSWTDLEHIIVDDDSTDGTDAVVEIFDDDRIEYIEKEENDGLSRTRNVGIRNASGEYLIFLDADDELLPHAVESLVASIESGEWVGVVPSKYWIGRKEGVTEQLVPEGIVTAKDLRKDNVLRGIGGSIFETDAIHEIGLFDPDLRHTEDYDLYLRMAERYPIYATEQLLYVHHTGVTDQLTSERGQYVHRNSIRRFLTKNENRLSSYRIAERHYRLAHICAREGDGDEALTEFRAAIAEYPFRPTYYYYLVSTRFGQDRYELARWVHEKATDGFDENLPLHARRDDTR